MTLDLVRKRWWAALAVLMLVLLGLAWADGGVVPLRPVSEPVTLPGIQP